MTPSTSCPLPASPVEVIPSRATPAAALLAFEALCSLGACVIAPCWRACAVDLRLAATVCPAVFAPRYLDRAEQCDDKADRADSIRATRDRREHLDAIFGGAS